MRKIRNYEDLLSTGCEDSRRIVLDIAEETLQRLDSYKRIKSIMHMDGDTLVIGERTWDLSKKRNVYLLGAGKAANHMAMAVDEILGDHLTKGIIIVKIQEKTDIFRRTDVYVGGHPLPNHEGYQACLKILDLVDHASPDDLFLCVVSGGSSSLMSCPVEGLTLEEELKTTDVMLKSGAGIYEINAIRRHISAMNGGMLAWRIQQRGAEMIGIGISDAVGKMPTGDIGIPYESYTSTPIGPDNTTLDDARRAIRDYGVETRLPARVVDYLIHAGPECETPKAFPDNTYYLLNTLPDSCLYAKKVCEEKGLPAVILTTFLEGESKDAGKVLASVAKEIHSSGTPFTPPCVILTSGEVTTEIPDNQMIKGHGGPSHEMTTGFALACSDAVGACLLSIDSEGTDGTTLYAGGITDSSTLSRATEKDLSLQTALREHSCFEALAKLGDSVFTGNTGTNLCDLNILYIPGKQIDEKEKYE